MRFKTKISLFERTVAVNIWKKIDLEVAADISVGSEWSFGRPCFRSLNIVLGACWWVQRKALCTEMLMVLYQQSMGVPRGGKTGISPPLEIETKNKNFQESWNQQLNSDQLIKFLQWQFMYQNDTHIARKPGSLFWYYALMSLQITPVRSYACRGRWSNLRAVCSVCLYCVIITWQQIFKGSLQVTPASIFRMWLLKSAHLGRYTAAREWLLIAVNHAFLYCVKSTN